ncbi:MAG TPA: WYL domain-containing protein [Actinomycetota bacterium]|nr:WYL domain-containing protein [Actinomycetota bacterium]
MTRIERLINLIIALLETTRPLSAEEINRRVGGYGHENYESFRRAFERDKDELRGMGVPIEVRKIDALDEHSDGYIIDKDRYYLPDLELEPDELAALRLARDAVTDGRSEADRGLLKISVDSRAAPVEGPQVAWGDDIRQPALSSIYEAQLERTPISFDYQGAAGERARRTLEPYGLVNRRGHWYVVGNDIDRSDIRAFRISRIHGKVSALEGGYDIPARFDAQAHLSAEAYAIGDQPADALVRFDDSLAWWVEQNLATADRTRNDDGSTDVTLPVGNLDALVSWVIGFGSSVEVIGPPEARDAVVAQLRPLLDGRSG